jgi:thiol-disulfide isomerase/thioredoxin
MRHKLPPYTLWLVAGVLIGLLAGLAALLVFGPGRAWLDRRNVTSLAPAVPQIDRPAPDFPATTLDGQPVRLSDWQGKLRVVNFWATWCGPCQVEMPLLEEAQKRYADQLVVLAVNSDEPASQVKGFVDKLDLSMPVLLDPGTQIAQLYRVRGLPTTLFIDEKGVLRYQHIGLLSEGTLAGYLEELGVNQ